MSTTVITSLPYTINSPGTYILDTSAYINSNGININANDVTLDLNGNSIVRYGALNNTNKGVYISPNLTNIKIKNGTIRGFFYGVHFDDTSYQRTFYLDSVNIQDCTFRGVVATGKFNFISNCLINNISGTTVYTNPFAIGIECTGTAIIENNRILEVYGTGSGEGVHISSTDHGYETIINNNYCVNKNFNNHTWSIWVGGDSQAFVTNNIISNAENGISFSSTTSGGYKNNIFYNCTNTYVVNSTNVIGL